MAFLRWLIALPFIVVIVAFAIANPNDVLLVWSPIHEKLSLPLYALSLGFLGIGFLLGSMMTWFGMGKVRAERRTYKKENKRLEKELNKHEKSQQKKDPMTKQIEKDQKELKELESLIP